MRPLDEQVVVVTGASSGIGRCTAQHLAKRGAKVVVTARREDALDELVAGIRAEGGAAIAVPGDVTREDDLARVADAAVERFGRVDTWVNCAAVYLYGRVDDVTLDEYRRVLDVDVVGYMNGAKQALRVMRRQGSGVIVMVSSIVAKRGAPNASAYSAAKGAIDGFTQALRAELIGTGIYAATVYPPAVDTPIYDASRTKFDVKPRPTPPVMDAELVAKGIAKLAVRPRPARFLGLFRYVYVGMQSVSPRLSDYFLHHTQGFMRGDAPRGADNLEGPSPTPATVRVGWKKKGIRGFTLEQLVRVLPVETALAAAVVGGVGAALGIAAARRLRAA